MDASTVVGLVGEGGGTEEEEGKEGLVGERGRTRSRSRVEIVGTGGTDST